MTAFAAVLSLDGSAPAPDDLAAVGAALCSSTGAPVGQLALGACTLISSPPSFDSCHPARSASRCSGVVGQVVLEGGGGLSTIADAYDRDGVRCTERIAGEYAFALWDGGAKRLLCARDGLGVRIVYVATAKDAIIVSNLFEAVAASRCVGRDLDEEAIVQFLANGTFGGIATPYRAVRMVPEGHRLTLTADRGVSLERHWRMPLPPLSRVRDPRDIVAGYRDVLRAAVDDRIGDQRATIFLSGGIDSTTMAAAASDRGSRLRAVTAEYGRVRCDDAALAREAAAVLSIPVDTIDGDRFEALERCGATPGIPIDEPTLADWRAALRHASRVSPVVLYGEDGYGLFAPPGGRALLRSHGRSIAGAVARYAITYRARPYLGIRLRQRLGLVSPKPPANRPRWLRTDAVRLLDRREVPTVLGYRPRPLPPHPTRPEMQAWLLDAIPSHFALMIAPDLTRVPVEIRLPLLDSRVIAYVASIPPIPWCQRKQLAREAFRADLPGAIVDRPKTPVRGFYEALVASWRKLRLPHIDDGAADRLPWIDRTEWLDALRAGTAAEVTAAWRVLLLDDWLRSCTR